MIPVEIVWVLMTIAGWYSRKSFRTFLDLKRASGLRNGRLIQFTILDVYKNPQRKENFSKITR